MDLSLLGLLLIKEQLVLQESIDLLQFSHSCFQTTNVLNGTSDDGNVGGFLGRILFGTALALSSTWFASLVRMIRKGEVAVVETVLQFNNLCLLDQASLPASVAPVAPAAEQPVILAAEGIPDLTIPSNLQRLRDYAMHSAIFGQENAGFAGVDSSQQDRPASPIAFSPQSSSHVIVPMEHSVGHAELQQLKANNGARRMSKPGSTKGNNSVEGHDHAINSPTTTTTSHAQYNENDADDMEGDEDEDEDQKKDCDDSA